MYTITADVRTDVLAAFDANLEDWEDRSEELAALIHLEDEVRDYGSALASADAETSTLPTATIDVRLDVHDHAAFERILRGGAEAGILFTALDDGCAQWPRRDCGSGGRSTVDPRLTPLHESAPCRCEPVPESGTSSIAGAALMHPCRRATAGWLPAG